MNAATALVGRAGTYSSTRTRDDSPLAGSMAKTDAHNKEVPPPCGRHPLADDLGSLALAGSVDVGAEGTIVSSVAATGTVAGGATLAIRALTPLRYSRPWCTTIVASANSSFEHSCADRSPRRRRFRVGLTTFPSRMRSISRAKRSTGRHQSAITLMCRTLVISDFALS